MKTGWKTTEFWAAVLVAVIPIINEYCGTEIPTESIAGLIAYILGRSGIKYAELRDRPVK